MWDIEYLCVIAVELDVFGIHDIQKDLKRDYNIGVDDGSRLVTLLLREASAVDDAHLLDNGRLSRLSSTWLSCQRNRFCCMVGIVDRYISLTK